MRLYAAVLATLPLSAQAKSVTISNVWPRHNVTGDVIDAHDGSYSQWTPGGPWYYYAMGYGTCKQGQAHCHGCGYGYSWIGVWQSPDMSNNTWKLLREARDDTWPKQDGVGAYFRVHVVYNALTKLYVMWVNLSNCSPGCYVVGTSSTPEGPFTYRGAVNARYPGAGDFDILVDDDGAGYLMYTSTTQGHKMSIERLRDDYLSSVYSAAPPTPPPPPTPEPSFAGFKPVGNGACRDGAGKEPPFFTNEGGAADELFPAVTEADCASACSGDSACTAFSWCTGDGAGSSCSGACHLYVTAKTPAPADPAGVTWGYKDLQGGNPRDVTKVTSESWWRCYAAGNTPHYPMDTVLSKNVHNPMSQPLTGDVAGPEPGANSSGYFGIEFVEAPAVFKREGIYYALFGNCCCFCQAGSGIGVYTASHPIGPWTYHNNVGCTGGEPTPGCGCGMNHGSCPKLEGTAVTKAQQNFVIQVRSPGGGVEYVWTGDMWQSARDGIKAHDRQFWAPLQFSNGSIPLPMQVQWIDSFELNVDA